MGLTDSQMEYLVGRSLPDKETSPIEHEVYAALNAYKLALIRAGYRGVGHRFMCWIGDKEAVANSAILAQAKKYAQSVLLKSQDHRLVLERIVMAQSEETAKRDNFQSLLSGTLDS